MKFTILSALLILSKIALFAQACDNCSNPRVALYDCHVNVPRPVENPDMIIAWQTLFWPSAAARGYFRTNDATKNCIVWIDGAMVNALDLQNGKLKFGSEYSNLPPAGPLNSSDYLITSKAQSRGSNYLFTLILETAVSREVVKSVEVEFSANAESANNAGQQAAKQMMPLFETIRKFEIEKRNSNVNVAISDLWTKNKADQITVKPKKSVIEANETVDIDITMIDCDGVPLSNRKIIFNDTIIQVGNTSSALPLKGTRGGKITPRVAVTDEAGKVTIHFKPDNTSKIGQIVAWYPHQKPCGRSDAIMGTAIVQITPLPPKSWILEGQITSLKTISQDTVISFDMGGMLEVRTTHMRWEVKSQCKIIAVIENQAENPLNEFEYDSSQGEPLILVTTQGSSDEDSNSRRTIKGQLVEAGVRCDNVAGREVSDIGIQFAYSPDYKMISLGVLINAVGSTKMSDYSRDWKQNEYAVDDYSINCSVGGNPEDDKNCRITKTNAGYQITYTFKENTQRSNESGMDYIMEQKTLSAKLTPVKDFGKQKQLQR